jgi:hypothetical protein
MAVVAVVVCLTSSCVNRPRQHRKVKVNNTVITCNRVPQPCIDLPLEHRPRNPDGSCVHISFATVLYNQNQHNLADWWLETYHGGEHAQGLRNKAVKAGIPYSDTTSGSIEWIDWACRTGRGAIVNDKPRHVRTLMGLDPAGSNAKAYVLDNNGPKQRLYEYDREEWIRMWQRQGGWAATAVYSPNPALTWYQPKRR